jgi:hypothetical protein
MNEIAQTAMKASLPLSGRSFVLVTEHEDRRVEYHIRQRQPCWGELRKYERSHPTRCTQPSVNKPGDLHHPFPDGKPIGLAVNVDVNWDGYKPQLPEDHMKFILGDESIYKCGIGKTEVLYDDRGLPDAIYFDGLNVDPTILVNFLRTMATSTMSNIVQGYLDAGLSRKEAQVLVKLNGSYSIKSGYVGSGYPHSVRRVYQSAPHDFSGGTMEQRVDYNRPMQDYIFQAKVKGESWIDLCEMVGIPKYGARELNMQSVIIPKVKEIFRIVEERQDDISRPKHIWTTKGGVSNENEGWVIT